MRSLLADLKHALRIYLRTPVSSGLAVLVLAVAMAFVTAFLSMYVEIGLKGHPGFEQGSRLVTIGQTDGRQLTGLPAGFMGQMADEIRSLDAVSGVMATSLPLQGSDDPLAVELVADGFFANLRPRLHSGRGFELADHDADAAKVIVVSYRYWRDELDGADVLGTVIELNFQQAAMLAAAARTQGAPAEEPESNEFRVIGIMAPEMTGSTGAETDAWFPFERAIEMLLPAGNFAAQIRAQLTMPAFGVLSAGASARSVVEELRARYAEPPPELRLQPGFRLDAVGGIVSNMNEHRNTIRQLRLFLGASALIALVAAANVSLFLLARAPGRRRELGIRMAVGAPLGRLARQLASEASVLVLAGAVLGLLLSFWLGTFLRGLAFLREAAWSDISLLDWRVLGMLGAFLLVLTVLVALAPILGLKRLGIAASSRQIAARASLAQRFAGALQISIAGTLAGAAIAFGWYLGSITLADPGYEFNNRQLAQFTVNTNNIDVSRVREIIGRSFIELSRRREAIEAIPGVEAVSFGTPIPGLNSRSTTQIPDPDDPSARIQLRTGSIDAHYVDVLGLRLIHGRNLNAEESESALVNQAFAQKFFGRDDVVGESAPIATAQGAVGPQIVGVLADLSFEHPAAAAEPIMFRQTGNNLASLLTGTAIIETALSPAALQRELERVSGAGEIEVSVASVRPLLQLRDTLLAPDRARSWLTIGAATLVVLLAAFGFYGTQRYLVMAGRREYAIRASLGAGPKSLGRLVLRRGLTLGLPGLVLGTLLAYITVSWLRDDFISRDISAFAVTLAVVVGLMLLLGAASLGPSRQARRTQPAPLLRED